MSTRPNTRPITNLLRQRGFTLLSRTRSRGVISSHYEKDGVHVEVYGGRNIGANHTVSSHLAGLVKPFATAEELRRVLDHHPLMPKPKTVLEEVTGLTQSERDKLVNTLRRGTYTGRGLEVAANLIEKLSRYVARQDSQTNL